MIDKPSVPDLYFLASDREHPGGKIIALVRKIGDGWEEVEGKGQTWSDAQLADEIERRIWLDPMTPEEWSAECTLLTVAEAKDSGENI